MKQLLFGKFASAFLDRNLWLAGRWPVTAPTLFVFALSTVINIIGAAGGAFMFYPDSATYVSPAYIFFHDGTLNGVSLFRMPGYPIFLAPLFGLFGPHAILAMAIVQHAMTTLISVVVVRIGDELDRTRWLGLVAGVFSAFALQIHAYARLPMTEVPFTFISILGLLFALRYLRTGDSAPFLSAVALFCVAAMIRPVGMYMPLVLMAVPVARALFPDCAFFAANDARESRKKNFFHLLAAGALFAVIVTPWMLRNLSVHNYFGLSPTIGVNLYGAVIDSEHLIDERSPAVADIKKRWDEFERIRIARGEPPETRYDWRQHVVSLGYYMAATKKTLMEADKVFLQAAVDGIRAHPWGYFRLVLRSIYHSFVYADPAFRYVPGVETGHAPPSCMPYALPATDNEESRQTLYRIAATYQHDDQNPFVWRQPTFMTPAYGALMSAYYAVQMRGKWLLLIFAFGLGTAAYLTLKQRHLMWIALVVYFAYVAVAPFLIVPGSPRHRLAADPVIDVITALALIHMAVLACRAWAYAAEIWRRGRDTT